LPMLQLRFLSCSIAALLFFDPPYESLLTYVIEFRDKNVTSIITKNRRIENTKNMG